MANWKSNEYKKIVNSSSANEYLSDENARRALAMGKDIVGEVITLANLARNWKRENRDALWRAPMSWS